MKLTSFLRRNRVLSHSLVGVSGVLGGLAIGIYVNLVTPDISQWLGGHGPTLLLVLAAVFTVLQIYILVALSGSPERDTVQDQVRCLLEATTRALIHPHTIERYQMRAQCRIANVREKRLEAFCQWSHPVCPDNVFAVDYDGADRDLFVISRAFRTRVILAEDLPVDHLNRLEGRHRGMIWKELRSVLAAPIHDPRDGKASPIGVISFDSDRPLDKSQLDSEDAKKLAELVAASIYPLIADL